MGGEVHLPPNLPDMNSHIRNQNLWNCHSNGGRYICHLICQIWVLSVGFYQYKSKITIWGVDLPPLVWPIWAVNSRNQHPGNCHSNGGEVHLSPDLPDMSSHSRNQNLWNCHSRVVDLPLDLPDMTSHSRILSVPIKNHHLGGRSATPGLTNMSCQQ